MVLHVPIVSVGSFLQSNLWRFIVSSLYFLMITIHIFRNMMGKLMSFSIAFGLVFSLFQVIVYNLGSTINNKELILKLVQLNEETHSGSLMKSNFLSTIGHEIRTPLSAIIGSADLLLTEFKKSKRESNTGLTENQHFKEQKSYLKTILSASNNLLNSMNSVLHFMKYEATGDLKLEHKQIVLRKTIKNVMKIMKIKADEKQLNLNVEYDEYFSSHPNFFFTTDETRLEEVLLNLLSNSVKFTPSHGNISVKVKRDEHKLIISVHDSGCGIAQEFQKHVFKPFSQQDMSLERKYEGSGLGLSICKSIVEAMKGKIWFVSEQGKGTTFYVALPMPQVEEELNGNLPSKATTSSTCETCDVSHLSCLIVDDNNVNIKVLSKMLQHCNVPHKIANSGYEAIELVKQYTFNLVLMDVSMPQMNGIEASQRIREMARMGIIEFDPLIILVTGADLSSIEDQAKSISAEILQKPLSLHTLKITLEQVKKKLAV